MSKDWVRGRSGGHFVAQRLGIGQGLLKTLENSFQNAYNESKKWLYLLYNLKTNNYEQRN